MPPLSSRLSTRVVALATAMVLSASVAGVASASPTRTAGTTGVGRADAGATTPAPQAQGSWAKARRTAEAALERAQAQLAGPASSRPASTRTDLTLTLRDLHAGLPYLGRADRLAAQRVLARPTQGLDDPNGDGYLSTAVPHRTCTSTVCVWWVTDTKNRRDPDLVPAADADSDGIPDQVELTSGVMSNVWDRIVTRGGYRAPLSDGKRGRDGRFDVYLADIGDEGLFGYCAPEGAGPGRSTSGYCVLDNDFSPAQFGSTQTPLGNLEVTAAHEFFHAVQFAYDAFEDEWFMEGTAMWMEDEVYDDVNDNVRYLRGSQLTTPTRPLDRPAAGLGGPYVSWIFWRFLSETFPDDAGTGLPIIVRRVWERAQGYDLSKPHTYSLRALGGALRARGSSLPTIFARFGAANRNSRAAYTEGAQQRYPVVPPVASYTLGLSRRSIAEKVATMPHLTNYTIVFTPGSDLTAAGWRIRIPLDTFAPSRGARAQLTVVRADGTRTKSGVALDGTGRGVAVAPFRRGEVQRVELTLTNAGQRYRCNQGTAQACGGTSLDDGLKSYFKATTVR